MIRDTIELTEDMTYEIIANNITTSVEDLIIDDNFAKVFPNPAYGQLNIQKEGTETTIIQVFDLLGKKILELDMNGTTMSIPTNGLQGNYIVKISDGIRATSKKILVK